MTELDGNPTDIGYYPGQERFSDGQFQAVDEWTAELALQATRALDLPDRADQVDRIRDALDDGLLNEQARQALVDAGWTELAD